MDDAQIIELFFSRNETAIDETSKKYGGLCRDIAYNILHSRSDSEECVNDAYLSLWNTIPPTRPENLKNFLCRITRNLSLKKLRHDQAKKRSKELEVSLTELEGVLPDDSIAVGVSDDVLSELLSEFLRGLSPDARNMFIRKYWFFDSLSDIASMYGSSESKVKSSLYRSREKLKEFLNEKGVRI